MNLRSSLIRFLKSNVITKSLIYSPYIALRDANLVSALQKRIADNSLLDDLDSESKRVWNSRIDDVIACEDNLKIPRHPQAGSMVDGHLIMHNGLKVHPLSYYEMPMLSMLIKNKGVHEPQEEYVFLEVLKRMPEKAVILELGSYWAYYSMCFHHSVKHPSCYLIEAKADLLELGKRNFELNKMNGKFFQYFVTAESGNKIDGIQTTSVDDFVKEQEISFVDILHCDIEGNELAMLKGATNLLKENRIAYVFISTHSNSLHQACQAFLTEYKFSNIASANLDQSYSYDGILVMKSSQVKNAPDLSISLKS